MNNREELYRAAISCRHEITHDQIILYVDSRKEGNALSQLTDRLEQAALASQAQQEPVTPERNMLRPPTVNLSTCFVGGLINRDTPEVAIGKINKELEKSIAEYFKSQQTESKPVMPVGFLDHGGIFYSYREKIKDGTELYVIPPAPEGEKP